MLQLLLAVDSSRQQVVPFSVSVECGKFYFLRLFAVEFVRVGMMIEKRQKKHRRRGAAIVEAALILPVFFMVVLGIVEFGRAFMISQMLQNSAREACRKAVTGAYANSVITSDITTELQAGGVKPADVTVSILVTVEAGNPPVVGHDVAAATTRDLVSVTVSVPFSKVALIPGNYLGGKTLTGRSTMRHE